LLFARLRLKGKPIRRSPKPQAGSAAKPCPGDLEKPGSTRSGHASDWGTSLVWEGPSHLSFRHFWPYCDSDSGGGPSKSS